MDRKLSNDAQRKKKGGVTLFANLHGKPDLNVASLITTNGIIDCPLLRAGRGRGINRVYNFLSLSLSTYVK